MLERLRTLDEGAIARSVQQRWQEQPADTRERNPGELIRQAIHIERVRLLEAATD